MPTRWYDYLIMFSSSLYLFLSNAGETVKKLNKDINLQFIVVLFHENGNCIKLNLRYTYLHCTVLVDDFFSLNNNNLCLFV